MAVEHSLRESIPDDCPINLGWCTHNVTHKDIRDSAIIEELLVPGGLMQITAASKGGKSFLLAQLALQLSNGGTIFGRKVQHPQKVLFYDGEIGHTEWDARMHELSRHMCLSTERIRSIHRNGFNGQPGTPFKEVVEVADKLSDMGFGILIIDPISAILEGRVKDENSNMQVYSAMTAIRDVFWQHGITIIYAHHHNKQGTARDIVNSGSGAGSFGRVGTAFIDIELNRKSGLIARFKSRSFRELDTVSVNEVQIHDDHGGCAGKCFEWEPLTQVTENVLRDRIIEYLKQNPGANKTVIQKEVTGNKDDIGAELNSMIDSGMVERTASGRTQHHTFIGDAIDLLAAG